MWKKFLPTIDWKHAIGEIALIFIGITMAIWFNNWNESRRARIVELKSLQEISGAIHQDLKDIEENILGFQQRVVLYEVFVEHIECQLLLTDSLRLRIPFLQGVTTFLSNIGPFETLKSRGLETISNDSLRIKVSLYYDLEYDRIQSNELRHHQHYNEYLKPMMLKHFDLSSQYLEPLHYDEIVQNFEFKQIIYWALRNDSYMLNCYQSLDRQGRALIVDIDSEIERLD